MARRPGPRIRKKHDHWIWHLDFQFRHSLALLSNFRLSVCVEFLNG
jgi:hypothetical protein